MPHRFSCSLIVLSAGLLVSGCRSERGPFAAAYEISSLDQGVGGPKAMAREGDLLLENDHFRVAILSGRNSLGPGLFGGSILDADIQRHDPHHGAGAGNDRLAEIFPTVSMNVTRPDVDGVYVASDGSDGDAAVVRVEGPVRLDPLGEGTLVARFAEFRWTGGRRLPFVVEYHLAGEPQEWVRDRLEAPMCAALLRAIGRA